MPNTYVALRTETVAVATNTVTFDLTGISGYTDLVVVANATVTGSGDAYMRVGNTSIDTGSNYSRTWLIGSGTSALSGRESNGTFFYLNVNGINASDKITYNISLNNYANTTTNKTVLFRNGYSQTDVVAAVGLWRSTSAITTINFVRTANNWAVGSTFSLYGIANADQGAAKATGGIITEDSQYWYHTFAVSGTFTPKQALTCDYLVVAGGAGGSGNEGAGGGAGGLRSTVTATGGGGALESPIAVISGTPYAITVGAGGPGGFGTSNGTAGVNSTFSTITSTGGGGGAYNAAGISGGSGGGGTYGNPGGTGTTNQGRAGGSGANSGFYGGGGGGGASTAGGNGSSTTGGNGGNGVTTSITGLSLTYAGGGGGGGFNSGTSGIGGSGGGGNAGQTTGASGLPATANTGGGGGGARWGGSQVGGGNGASGIVVIRYAK